MTTTTTSTYSAGGALAREGGADTREGGVSARVVRDAVHKTLRTIVSEAVLEKGIELHGNGLVQSTLLPHIFHVGVNSYRVDVLEPHCECRGFRFGNKGDEVGDGTWRFSGRVCKHIVAAGYQFMLNDALAGGIDA